MDMPLPGTLFVLALHGTTPTCDPWSITPTTLTSDGVTVDAHVAGDELVFEGIHRGELTATCTSELPLHENSDGFDVGGARWFRTRAACQAAVRRHAHVAMRWPCDIDDDAPADPVPATKRRFDAVLAYGGILYAEGACNRVRFEARKTTASSIEGSLSYRIAGGMEGYDYEGKRGDPQLTLLGPGDVMDDGITSATGCADDITLLYYADRVIVTAPLYFDQASCKAATERTRYRESWLPGASQEAAFGGRPLAGGC